MGLYTQQDPIGIAGGLNLYGYAGGDPVNYSDPFGLCPPEEKDCELISEATAGGTVGTKWKGTLATEGAGSLVGLGVFAGVSVEAGMRQTANYADGYVENEPVGVVKIGFSASVSLFGAELSIRVGFDSSDSEGGLLDIDLKPNHNFEVQGMTTLVGPGASGSFKLNPYTSTNQLAGPRLPGR